MPAWAPLTLQAALSSRNKWASRPPFVFDEDWLTCARGGGKSEVSRSHSQTAQQPVSTPRSLQEEDIQTAVGP